jgi:hypothetical protein
LFIAIHRRHAFRSRTICTCHPNHTQKIVTAISSVRTENLSQRRMRCETIQFLPQFVRLP